MRENEGDIPTITWSGILDLIYAATSPALPPPLALSGVSFSIYYTIWPSAYTLEGIRASLAPYSPYTPDFPYDLNIWPQSQATPTKCRVFLDGRVDT